LTDFVSSAYPEIGETRNSKPHRGGFRQFQTAAEMPEEVVPARLFKANVRRSSEVPQRNAAKPA